MSFPGKRAGFVCLTVLLAAPLVPGVVLAQTQSEQDLMSLSIEDLTKVKVYSASRHMENVRQAPSAVSIITTDQIKRYGWRTLGDALNSLRGFYTSYDRQYTYLGVRGFLRPGDYNSRILVLVNGHRLNENVYDSAPMGTEFPLDLDLIDHIEVVRGPGSSLFGTNAVFGVINVITRGPKGKSAVEVSGDTSSFLARTGRLTAMGSGKRGSALISGSMYRSAGQSSLFFPEFASPETNNGYADNVDGSRFGDAFADLQYGEFRLQASFSDRSKQYPTASYGTLFNDPTNHIEDTRGYLDASYHRSLSSQTDFDVRTYYDAYNSSGAGAFGGTESTERLIGLSKARADWVGTEANLGKQIGKQRITIGGQYEYSIDVKQRNYFANEPAIFQSDDSPWLAAVYGEAELNLLPKVTIHAGGRMDWFDAFGGTLSPRAAVVYSPDSRTDLKYIFGRAFRSPNAYEEYYVDGVAITAAPRPLKPEQILSHEIVFEHSLTSWLSMTVDGYYDKLDKLIDQVPAPGTELSYFVNDGHIHDKGLEFELEAQSSGPSARASYVLSRAENDVVHSSLDNSPLNQAKLNATLPVWRRGFAGFGLMYVSAEQDYRGARVPPFLLTNLTLSSRPLWGGWEFAASCYNLLDRRWFSPMGPNDPEARIEQDGRTYRIKLSYHLRLRGERRGK